MSLLVVLTLLMAVVALLPLVLSDRLCEDVGGASSTTGSGAVRGGWRRKTTASAVSSFRRRSASTGRSDCGVRLCFCASLNATYHPSSTPATASPRPSATFPSSSLSLLSRVLQIPVLGLHLIECVLAPSGGCRVRLVELCCHRFVCVALVVWSFAMFGQNYAMTRVGQCEHVVRPAAHGVSHRPFGVSDELRQPAAEKDSAQWHCVGNASYRQLQ